MAEYWDKKHYAASQCQKIFSQNNAYRKMTMAKGSDFEGFFRMGAYENRGSKTSPKN